MVRDSLIAGAAALLLSTSVYAQTAPTDAPQAQDPVLEQESDAPADTPGMTDPAAPAGTEPGAAAGDAPAATDPGTAVGDAPAATDPGTAVGDAPAATDTPATADAGPQIYDTNPPGTVLSSWIVGTNVSDPQGETIASVDSLIVDENEGRIEAIVLSVGGILGFGAKNVAVTYDDFDIRQDAQEIMLAMTREQLDELPEFSARNRGDTTAAAPLAQ